MFVCVRERERRREEKKRKRGGRWRSLSFVRRPIYLLVHGHGGGGALNAGDKKGEGLFSLSRSGPGDPAPLSKEERREEEEEGERKEQKGK